MEMGPIGRKKKYRKPGDEIDRGFGGYEPNEGNIIFVSHSMVIPSNWIYDSNGHIFLKFNYKSLEEVARAGHWVKKQGGDWTTLLNRNKDWRHTSINPSTGIPQADPFVYVPFSTKNQINVTTNTTIEQLAEPAPDSQDEPEDDYDEGDEDNDE